MRIIYKYVLEVTDYQAIELPKGTKILDFQQQNGLICMWALVDTDKPKELRRFWIIGTGHPVPDGWDLSYYLATVQVSGYVWHIFGDGK